MVPQKCLTSSIKTPDKCAYSNNNNDVVILDDEDENNIRDKIEAKCTNNIINGDVTKEIDNHIEKEKQENDIIELDDNEEAENQAIEPIKRLAKVILFGRTLKLNRTFTYYDELKEIENHLQNLPATLIDSSKERIWIYVLRLYNHISRSFDNINKDKLFNLHVINILGDYVNFQCSVFCKKINIHRKLLVKSNVTIISQHLYTVIDRIFIENTEHKLMVILKTDTTNKNFAYILYPLFARIHEDLLTTTFLIDNELIFFVAIILFYKYWKQMMITKRDQIELDEKAAETIQKADNHLSSRFHQMTLDHAVFLKSLKLSNVLSVWDSYKALVSVKPRIALHFLKAYKLYDLGKKDFINPKAQQQQHQSTEGQTSRGQNALDKQSSSSHKNYYVTDHIDLSISDTDDDDDIIVINPQASVDDNVVPNSTVENCELNGNDNISNADINNEDVNKNISAGHRIALKNIEDLRNSSMYPLNNFETNMPSHFSTFKSFEQSSDIPLASSNGFLYEKEIDFSTGKSIHEKQINQNNEIFNITVPGVYAQSNHNNACTCSSRDIRMRFGENTDVNIRNTCDGRLQEETNHNNVDCYRNNHSNDPIEINSTTNLSVQNQYVNPRSEIQPIMEIPLQTNSTVQIIFRDAKTGRLRIPRSIVEQPVYINDSAICVTAPNINTSTTPLSTVTSTSTATPQHSNATMISAQLPNCLGDISDEDVEDNLGDSSDKNLDKAISNITPKLKPLAKVVPSVNNYRPTQRVIPFTIDSCKQSSNMQRTPESNVQTTPTPKPQNIVKVDRTIDNVGSFRINETKRFDNKSEKSNDSLPRTDYYKREILNALKLTDKVPQKTIDVNRSDIVVNEATAKDLSTKKPVQSNRSKKILRKTSVNSDHNNQTINSVNLLQISKNAPKSKKAVKRLKVKETSSGLSIKPSLRKKPEKIEKTIKTNKKSNDGKKKKHKNCTIKMDKVTNLTGKQIISSVKEFSETKESNIPKTRKDPPKKSVRKKIDVVCENIMKKLNEKSRDKITKICDEIKDNSTVMVTDSSSVLNKNVKAEISEEIMKVSTHKEIDKISEGITKNSSQKVIDEISQEIMKNSSHKEIDGISEKIMNNSSQKEIDKISEGLMKNSCHKGIDEISEKLMKNSSQKVIDEISQEIIKNSSHKGIDGISEKIMKTSTHKKIDKISEEIMKNSSPKEIDEISQEITKNSSHKGIDGIKEIDKISDGLMKKSSQNDISQEIKKESSEKVIGDISQEIMKNSNQKEIYEISEEILKDSTNKKIDEIPEEIMKKSSHNEINEISEEMLKNSSRNEIVAISEDILKDSIHKKINEISDRIMKYSSHKKIDEISEKIMKDSTHKKIDEIPQEILKDSAYKEIDKISEEILKNSSHNEIDEISEEIRKDSTHKKIDEISKEILKGSTHKEIDKISKEILKGSTHKEIDEISEEIRKDSTHKKIDEISKEILKDSTHKEIDKISEEILKNSSHNEIDEISKEMLNESIHKEINSKPIEDGYKIKDFEPKTTIKVSEDKRLDEMIKKIEVQCEHEFEKTQLEVGEVECGYKFENHELEKNRQKFEERCLIEETELLQENTQEHKRSQSIEEIVKFKSPSFEQAGSQSTEEIVKFELQPLEHDGSQLTEEIVNFELQHFEHEDIQSTEEIVEFELQSLEQAGNQLIEEIVKFKSPSFTEQPGSQSTEEIVKFKSQSLEQPESQSTEEIVKFKSQSSEQPGSQSTEEIVKFKSQSLEQPGSQSTEEIVKFELHPLEHEGSHLNEEIVEFELQSPEHQDATTKNSLIPNELNPGMNNFYENELIHFDRNQISETREADSTQIIGFEIEVSSTEEVVTENEVQLNMENYEEQMELNGANILLESHIQSNSQSTQISSTESIENLFEDNSDQESLKNKKRKTVTFKIPENDNSNDVDIEIVGRKRKMVDKEKRGKRPKLNGAFKTKKIPVIETRKNNLESNFHDYGKSYPGILKYPSNIGNIRHVTGDDIIIDEPIDKGFKGFKGFTKLNLNENLSSSTKTPATPPPTTLTITKATTPAIAKATTPAIAKATTPATTKGTTSATIKGTTPTTKATTKATTPTTTKATTPTAIKATTTATTTATATVEPIKECSVKLHKIEDKEKSKRIIRSKQTWDNELEHIGEYNELIPPSKRERNSVLEVISKDQRKTPNFRTLYCINKIQMYFIYRCVLALEDFDKCSVSEILEKFGDFENEDISDERLQDIRRMYSKLQKSYNEHQMKNGKFKGLTDAMLCCLDDVLKFWADVKANIFDKNPNADSNNDDEIQPVSAKFIESIKDDLIELSMCTGGSVYDNGSATVPNYNSINSNNMLSFSNMMTPKVPEIESDINLIIDIDLINNANKAAERNRSNYQIIGSGNDFYDPTRTSDFGSNSAPLTVYNGYHTNKVEYDFPYCDLFDIEEHEYLHEQSVQTSSSDFLLSITNDLDSNFGCTPASNIPLVGDQLIGNLSKVIPTTNHQKLSLPSTDETKLGLGSGGTIVEDYQTDEWLFNLSSANFLERSSSTASIQPENVHVSKILVTEPSRPTKVSNSFSVNEFTEPSSAIPSIPSISSIPPIPSIPPISSIPPTPPTPSIPITKLQPLPSVQKSKGNQLPKKPSEPTVSASIIKSQSYIPVQQKVKSKLSVCPTLPKKRYNSKILSVGSSNTNQSKRSRIDDTRPVSSNVLDPNRVNASKEDLLNYI